MAKPKVAAKLDNVVFLSNIGAALRWATSEIPQEDLPAEIVRLLRRLDRVEKSARAASSRASLTRPL